MWTTNADAMKADFDTAFQRAYDSKRASGELGNLAKLFSLNALADYREALQRGLDPESDAWADIAWIDKRPIAKLRRDGPSAELGDMLLVVNHFDSGGRVASRACILEVKQSPTESIPPVPVTKGKSTANQFGILATWPDIFELKATGTSGAHLLRNVVTRDSAERDVLAQAWYAAVRPKDCKDTPWMVAPAVKGACFAHSLGSLFAACCRAEPLYAPEAGRPVGVGRRFTPGSTLSKPSNWDALVNTILSVVDKYDLPPTYFGLNAGPRRRSTRSSLPALAPIGIGSDLWHESLLSFTASCATIILVLTVLALQILSMMPPERLRWRLRPRDAFPVLTLTIVHGEPFELSPDRPIDWRHG